MSYNLENNPLFNGTDKNSAGRVSDKESIKKVSLGSERTKKFTRATFVVDVKLLEDLKNYAYTKRISIKDLVNQIFENSINDFKNNGGVLLDRNEVDT